MFELTGFKKQILRKKHYLNDVMNHYMVLRYFNFVSEL